VMKCGPSDTPKYTSIRRCRTFMLEGSSVDFALGVVRERVCVRRVGVDIDIEVLSRGYKPC
jgi:hypothetical protein